MSVPVAPVLSDFHVGSILMLMFSFVELSSECVLGSLCFERHRIGRELEGHRRVVAKGGERRIDKDAWQGRPLLGAP